jgi:glycosyltransferase involved in cell wall biosynthesis
MESTFFARALRTLLRDKSDLVIAITPSLAGLGAAAAGSGRRPFAAVVQDLTGNACCETSGASDRVGASLRATEYGLLKRCAKVGVITTDFGRSLSKAGLRTDQLVDLPNFSHIEAITASTADARRRLGWPSDRFTVVHTGNMGAKQGLETVVEAARLSHATGADIDFVLMGDGNQRSMLETLAAEVPSLRILPPVSAEDYPYVLAAADVVLINELPGVKMMSLPSKLTSYAAAGKPILAATDPDGITAHYLRDMQFGHVVESGCAQTLLDAARSLRANPVQLQALARASRRVHRTAYDKGAAYGRYQAFAASMLPTRAATKRLRPLQPAVGLVPQYRTATTPALALAAPMNATAPQWLSA